jgi:hypothetical protein
MAIGFRTSSSADIASATATVTITKPTGFASTDVLIAVFGTSKSSNVAHTITAPAGWTRIAAQVSQTNGTAEIILLDVFWALGSVVGLGFTNSTTGGGVQQGWLCAAFTGVDTTTPIDVAVVAGDKNTASATLTVSAITIATTNAWDCIAAADWLGGVFTVTSFTVAENGHTNASAALCYNTTPKSTGTTGTATLNSTAGANQILEDIRFALRPAAGGSVTLPIGAMLRLGVGR